VEVHITGGGAYKYYDTIVGSLNVSVVKVGEFESLSHGFDFLNHLQPNDSFYIHEHNAN
jgi:pantothenate kinase